MVFKGDKAIYLQIADYIMENILAKKWQKNDRIPSVRDMAVSIEVNPNTVAHSYNYMQDKGVLYNRRGVGYFVADDALTKALQIKKEAFFNDQLPRVFQDMLLLDIDPGEISAKFVEYRQKSLQEKE